jgi:hypothetical protein
MLFRTPAEMFAPASEEPGAVLLETQSPDLADRHSYLLRSPLKILASRRPEDVPLLLEAAAAWQGKGYPLAGFLSYAKIRGTARTGPDSP